MANTVITLASNTRDFEVLPSAARTADPDTIEFATGRWSGMVLIIDVTAIVATPSITVAIQGVDSVVSGATYTVLTSVAITAIGTTVMRIRPGGPVTANVATNEVLPTTIRIVTTHGDSDSVTYSVAAHLTN